LGQGFWSNLFLAQLNKHQLLKADPTSCSENVKYKIPGIHLYLNSSNPSRRPLQFICVIYTCTSNIRYYQHLFINSELHTCIKRNGKINPTGIFSSKVGHEGSNILNKYSASLFQLHNLQSEHTSFVTEDGHTHHHHPLTK